MEIKILTKAEIVAYEKRLKNDLTDPHSIYSRKVRPKLKEIIDFWLPRKNEIEKILIQKKQKTGQSTK